MRHKTMMVQAAAIVLGLASMGRAAELRVAVIDMQRALNECEAGKKAKEQVKGKLEKAQEQLKRQRDEFDRAREDFDKKSLVLKEDQRRDLEKELEAKSLELKRKYEDFQRDFKRADAELTSGIVDQLYGVVAEYGQEHNLTLVIEASSGVLLYNDKSVDITDEVIKLHNANPNKVRAGKRPGSGGE